MHFGTTSTGVDVAKITLQAGDMRVAILTWGAFLQDVRLAGVDYGLTLGSKRIADYEGDMRHHGGLIGPIVNRISTARVKLAGMMYELERNENGTVHLHSGAQALHRRSWNIVERSQDSVTMECTLADGECGLPGRRVITVTYRVSAPATLQMDVTARTDSATPMNIANHSYWNLDGTDTWTGHHLHVQADQYLPTKEGDLPTGEIADVAHTPMDLRKGRVLDSSVDRFDNNYCLSDARGPLRHVMTLTGQSGVQMQMATTEAGLQVYDNKNGARPDKTTFEGLAFEAQFWPDAPNFRAFPSIILQPDQTYAQTTTWQFSQT